MEKRSWVVLNHQAFGQQLNALIDCATETVLELQRHFQTIDIISEYNIYNFDILYAFLSLSHKKFQYQNYF